MSHQVEKTEFAEFEIVKDLDPAARAISPWQSFRVVAMGLIGLALLFVALLIGLFLIIPIFGFIMIAKTIALLFSAGTRT